MDFYSFEARNLEGEMVSMSAFKDKVVLIENTASSWGATARDFKQMNQLRDGNL